DIGYISRERLSPQIENKIFSLKEGEVSDPIETENGFHIIKVTEKAKVPPLDQVKGRIEIDKKKMKKFKLKLFFIVFLGLFFISKPSISGEIIDRVAAVVNDDVITLSEVKEETLLINQNPGPEGPQTQDQVLENMIEEKLLEQEAKKLGIQVTEKDVDAG